MGTGDAPHDFVTAAAEERLSIGVGNSKGHFRINLRVRSVTSVFCSSGFVKAVEFVFPVDTEIQWKFGIEHHGLALE